MTNKVEGGSPLAGPLTKKLSLRNQRELVQLKRLMIQMYHEKLSEKHGTEKVNPWMEKVFKLLSRFQKYSQLA